MSTHTSWDEGVRMNPELQPNLKIKNQTNKKNPSRDSTLEFHLNSIEFHPFMSETWKQA